MTSYRNIDLFAVFVYGTLKSGHHNRMVVDDLVQTTTRAYVRGFRLFDVGFFPGVEFTGNDDDLVWGEVLTFAPEDMTEALVRLDRLEGTPSLYTRNRTTAWESPPTEGIDAEAEAWIYTYNHCDGLEVIESGEWTGRTTSGIGRARLRKARREWWNQ